MSTTWYVRPDGQKWVPAYRKTKADVWCHVRRACVVGAQLQVGGMEPVVRAGWYNNMDKCVVCRQWINWTDEGDGTD